MQQQQQPQEGDELARRRQAQANAELYDRLMNPTDLRQLFLDPQAIACNWIEALIHHQDLLAPGTQERLAFHLGDRFRDQLGHVHQLAKSWWPYALVAILAYLFHSPWSRTRLRRSDEMFLCGPHNNFRQLLDSWMKGVKPDGSPIATTEDAHHNHTIGLAYNLHQLYTAHWMLDPDEERQLSHAQLCAPL